MTLAENPPARGSDDWYEWVEDLHSAVKTFELDPDTLLPPAAVQESFSRHFGVVLPSPGATVDVMPTIQSLVKTFNARWISLVPTDVYYADSTVFIANPDPRYGLTIACNNARWNIGPNAGSIASNYRGTAGTRFLFFVNTKAEALIPSSNTVTISEANTATGEYVATVRPGLTIRDFDFRGNNQLVRVAHLHNSTGKFLVGFISYMNGLAATSSYCDSMEINARQTNPFGADASLLKQEGPGDNGVFNVNSDARGRTLDLQYAAGTLVQASVGGSIRARDCRALRIVGLHTEGDEPTRTMQPLDLGRTETVVTGELWAGVNVDTIVINDGASQPDAPGDVLFDALTIRSMYRKGSVADERQRFDVYFEALNDISRIRARGFFSAVGIVEQTQSWRMAPVLGAKDPALQAALDAGHALIASGSWELVRRDDAWKVVPLENPSLLAVEAVTAVPRGPGIQDPQLSSWGGAGVLPLGAMPAGTFVYYFALVDGNGVFGPRTLGLSVTTTAAKPAVRAIVTIPRGGRLAVWRQPQGQPVDRFALLGVASTRVFLYDTGENISRRAWQKSNLPERPSTSSTASVNTYKFNGKTVTLT
jgi:hypothetical protein